MAATVEEPVTSSVGMEDPEASNAQEKSAPKHRLQHKWTLWFDQPKKKKSGGRLSLKEWNASLERVYSFGTVEDFWCLFNNLLPVSNLENGSSYNLFKEGISPQWEDKENDGGGRWYFTLRARDRDQCDQLWLHMVLGLIGENIDVENNVCGVVISPRHDEVRISLWTKKAMNRRLQLDIGRNMRDVLRMPSNLVNYCGYHSHDDDARRQKRERYRLSEASEKR